MVADPIVRFLALFEDAKRLYPELYNAMTLSTVGATGRPSSRVVLLKAADARGFVFYCNLDSRKGRELSLNGFAALCFYWPALEHQVRVEGPVEPVTQEEADAYFATRPRGSQLGAWASQQSAPLPDRETLERKVAELEQKYEDREIPRPPHWSGTRVLPDRIEFWRNRANRLHDRELYTRMSADGPWVTQRLYP